MRKLASVLFVLLVMSGRAAAQPHLISLDVRDATLGDVIYMLAVQSGKDIVADASARRERVTLHIRNFTFDAVLELLARMHDLEVRRDGRVYLIASGTAKMPRAWNAGTPRVTAVPSSNPSIRLDVRVADIQLLPDQTRSSVQEFGGAQAASPPGGGSGFAFTKSTREIETDVDGLSAAGRLKVLAAATLVASSDREAGLLIGQQYPVVLGDARSARHVRLVDVGLRLRVKSSVDHSGSVTTVLRAQYSATDGATGSVPLALNRRFGATLRLSKDETIVLGGLFGDIDAQTVTKLPFLGEMAVLGAVFRARERRRPADELLFLITPNVIPSVPLLKSRTQRGNDPQ